MKHLAKAIKFAIFALGVLFLAMIVLAFTSKPFYWYFNLGQNPNEETSITRPESIVMFGGAGMPSEDNLMRLYHTAALACLPTFPSGSQCVLTIVASCASARRDSRLRMRIWRFCIGRCRRFVASGNSCKVR